jgi:hypothetical protein
MAYNSGPSKSTQIRLRSRNEFSLLCRWCGGGFRNKRIAEEQNIFAAGNGIIYYRAVSLDWIKIIWQISV